MGSQGKGISLGLGRAQGRLSQRWGNPVRTEVLVAVGQNLAYVGYLKEKRTAGAKF